MNEQIKELAKEAGLVNCKFSFGQRWEKQLTDEQKKFAELIVKECIDIGDNYQDILGNEPECFNCRKVAYGIVDMIKEHFGVKE